MVLRPKPSMSTPRGFTIIEFMVATVVFSVVIMTVSFAITTMSRIYQKSMYMSRAQAAARTLVDSIGEAVQFSNADIRNGTAVDGARTYCVGQKQYVYILGKRVGTNTGEGEIPHALMVGNTTLGDCVPPADYATTFSDMLGPGLRLSEFTITGGSGVPTKITATVAYGADTDMENPQQPNVSCKAGPSSTYCGVSKLATVVEGRLNL